ncbi:MAG: methylmalonyl Co-A mutase-associated GTPase MeaB [Dehalococcoidales bacterium]|nr:methylmalonyl Co-A mutase-associated GTPase MeaB [Dehalococcoidales bacterium]
MELLENVLKGDVLAAAKLMRGLEDGVPDALAELESVYLHTGRAYIVGVSGAPGAGKSTLLGCLIGAFRKRNMKVGVVAIDPTSPLTGGAILGDRLRMQIHGADNDVFIRSLASRGWKGGLSKATMNTVHVLDAMGKDIIFVEAVGSGQGEVDFARVADTSVVVLVPGMGDEIQTMKAGIMEMADIFVINKAERDGSENLKISLEAMLAMTPHQPDEWQPGIVLTEAILDKGTEPLAKEILRHRAFLVSSGGVAERRRRRAELELTVAVESALRNLMETTDSRYLAKLVDDLANRKTDPISAALKVINLPKD